MARLHRLLITTGFAVLVLLAVVRPAFADTDGVYDYTLAGGTATIDRYLGGPGDVIIPSTLGGMPVTAIGNRAFEYCSHLHSLIIPEGVVSVGDDAFAGCSGLSRVSLPDSVLVIGRGAFDGCDSMTSITIPSNVTSISEGAFNGCSSLTSITIPSNVTSIGDYAFYFCTSLTNITIPSSVTSIGNYAFCACWSLTSVTIQGGVTSIGNYAFGGCILTNITIPNSVTSIGDSAFEGCTTLTNVTIPSSVTSIGASAFRRCNSLTNVTIQSSMTSIGNYAFYGCTSLTSITIPSSVTSIGNYAFYDCTSLTNITIPSSVTSIGDSAFNGCNSLSSITIQGGVASIGTYAFYGCTSLMSITIPSSVTSIGEGAFRGCTSLTNIAIQSTMTSIGISAFYGCTSLTSVTISGSVTSIGSSAFNGCTSLASVTIQGGVMSIGHRAFYGCSSLTSITIPDNVTSIGDYTFYGCSSLTSITIPAGVTSIGYASFYGCSSLTDITIPAGVTTIGDHAFYFCPKLRSALFLGDAPSLGQSVFGESSPYFTVYFQRGMSGFVAAPGPWLGYRTWYLGTFDGYVASYDAGVGGSISGVMSQAVGYGESGTSVTAVPSEGYHFIMWSDGSLMNSRTDANLIADKAVTAVFAIDTHTLTYTAGTGGSIEGSSTQVVDYEANGTAVTAQAAHGYHFVKWSDGSTVNPRTDSGVRADNTVAAVFAPDVRPVTRAFGGDRYSTAASLACKGWDPTRSRTWVGVKHIIIANGETGKEPDPLAAAGLAGAYDCPVLLTGSTSLPYTTKVVLTEIARSHPGVQIHIVGGESAVPDARWNDIKKIPGVSQTEDRIAGRDRYETSVLMAKRIVSVKGAGAVNGIILIAGDNPAAFYDALAASPIAYAQTMPMLSVKKGSIPTSVANVLKSANLKDKPRYVASSATYIGSVPAAGATRMTTTSNRYAAATQIAKFAAVDRDWTSCADTALASKLPDALTGGAFLGKAGGVLLFTDSTSAIQPTSKAFITGNKDSIEHGWIIGGITVVLPAQETSFRNLLN